MRGNHAKVGAFLLFLGAITLSVLAQPCPQSCNGHGQCVTPDGQCQCFKGYTGGDCSQRVCPYGTAWADEATGIDVAHNLAECSNRGLCNRRTGLCECDENFQGRACERIKCPNDCSGNGKCMSMARAAASKDPGEGTVYVYKNIWDANVMYGCVCDEGFYGPDCSQRACPTGDDPLTGTNVDPDGVQVNEVQQVLCQATGGTFTLSFKGHTTSPIPYNADQETLKSYLQQLPSIKARYGDALGITYDGVTQEACNSVGNTISIEFLQNFGPQPLLVPDGGALLLIAGVPDLSVAKAVVGTKENDVCSNRGLCNAQSGTCGCVYGFASSDGYGGPGRRGDCGSPTVVTTTCPGKTECNGHGTCADAPTYRCSCEAGWTGADCSERTCPTGHSWFSHPSGDDKAHDELVECSDMGVCSRTTGQCTCMLGFEGSACQLMSCPGGANTCSGHGTCLTMAQLAEVATSNGDSTDFTYGENPNEPATWDAHRVRGCHCDGGYSGYDCSQQLCPFGDDPITDFYVDSSGQMQWQKDEAQRMTCVADPALVDGTQTIILKFRRQETEALNPATSPDELKLALESLSTVGKVLVESDDSETICTTAGNSILITFLTESGDLPLLRAETENVDLLDIVEVTKGTKEYLECNGRGICNRKQGQCSCFNGFTSSDGMRNPGNLGDCGYKSPILGGLRRRNTRYWDHTRFPVHHHAHYLRNRDDQQDHDHHHHHHHHHKAHQHYQHYHYHSQHAH